MNSLPLEFFTLFCVMGPFENPMKEIDPFPATNCKYISNILKTIQGNHRPFKVQSSDCTGVKNQS